MAVLEDIAAEEPFVSETQDKVQPNKYLLIFYPVWFHLNGSSCS